MPRFRECLHSEKICFWTLHTKITSGSKQNDTKTRERRIYGQLGLFMKTYRSPNSRTQCVSANMGQAIKTQKKAEKKKKNGL